MVSLRIAAAVGGLCVQALAQTELSLKDAVEQAMHLHPLLAAGEEHVAASTALVRQSTLRPNPRLYFQTENWRWYGAPDFQPSRDADTFAFVSQLVETGGKRHRRADLARANLRQSELERELVAKRIAGFVRQAYWHAAGAAKIRELWTENQKNFRQIIEYHEIRVREGAMAEADLIKVQLEGERLAVAANAAALDAERARIELFREMGLREFPIVRFSDSLVLDAQPPVGDAARALQDRTEMKLAQQTLSQRRAELRLQQSAAQPDFDVVLGYKRTAGFHTVMGGVQIGLPLVNRNQGNIEATTAEIRAADSELAAAEGLIRAEVMAAQAEVQMRYRQINELLRSAVRRAAESSRIALAAYREGGTDLLKLLDAERTRIEIEVLSYRTLSEYRQSVSALETAMGSAP